MEEELRKRIEQYTPIGAEAWNEFAENLVAKELKRNEHFLLQGDVCKRIGFIVTGYMRVYFLSDDEEVTKDFNFENSFCGSYASFSLQEPSRFNVVAMEDVKLYTIDREKVFYLFDKHPSLQKLGRVSIEHMFIRKEQREASFLLDTPKQRYEELIVQHPKIIQRVPLKYLASYLGVRAETLSRIRGRDEGGS